MWYEKRYSEVSGLWCVYECSSTRCVRIGAFKTEKGADNCIRKHKR